MEADADTAAPGAAITAALCGHWEHELACPLAPHHTTAQRVGATVHVRTLFVAEPGKESEVRQRIDTALSAGRLVGPTGPTTWLLVSSRPSALLARETDLAQRLDATSR